MKRNAPQTPSKLSAPIRQQLNSYALAAGTGLAILASAPPAEAEIVYTPTHQMIPTNHTFSLDLNHDGITDFIISNHAFCTSDICGRTLQIRPAGTRNRIVGMKSIFILRFASALSHGVKVGPSAIFSGNLMAVSGTEFGSGGPWTDARDRYLGLQFSIGNSTHYGWARLNVLANGHGKITAQITGYAYETIANRPILAGQTQENSAGSNASLSYPENAPPTIGMLALGSVAMPLWRRLATLASLR